MTQRIVVDAAYHSKTELQVKARRLEIMGLEHDLPAVSGFRFSLRSAHQPCTLALPAHAFRNEEIADIAGAPPSPAIETARTRAICGAQKDADETPVRDAGRSHVEINKTVLEEVNVLKARFGLHDQALGGRAV